MPEKDFRNTEETLQDVYRRTKDNVIWSDYPPIIFKVIPPADSRGLVNVPLESASERLNGTQVRNY